MTEPLSSIPDLIEMIRRERDELRELHRATEEQRDEWKARAESAEDLIGQLRAELAFERAAERADNLRLRTQLMEARCTK